VLARQVLYHLSHSISFQLNILGKRKKSKNKLFREKRGRTLFWFLERKTIKVSLGMGSDCRFRPFQQIF
jgi:hypothetical protein